MPSMLVVGAGIVENVRSKCSVAGNHARELLRRSGAFVPVSLYASPLYALRKGAMLRKLFFEPKSDALLRLPRDRVPFGGAGRLTWALRKRMWPSMTRPRWAPVSAGWSSAGSRR